MLRILRKEAEKLNPNVRDWYVKEFPTDSLGSAIREGVTFLDVAAALNTGRKVYGVLGVGDSVVRERVFSKLAEIFSVPYEKIYEIWLKTA